MIIQQQNSHQWFGNLVTCSWWDFLWLNEGFARYFQYFATETVSAPIFPVNVYVTKLWLFLGAANRFPGETGLEAGRIVRDRTAPDSFGIRPDSQTPSDRVRENVRPNPGHIRPRDV